MELEETEADLEVAGAGRDQRREKGRVTSSDPDRVVTGPSARTHMRELLHDFNGRRSSEQPIADRIDESSATIAQRMVSSDRVKEDSCVKNDQSGCRGSR